ncbi:MAG: cation diffusion facilitator family transporter [Bacteroidales bacterium]
MQEEINVHGADHHNHNLSNMSTKKLLWVSILNFSITIVQIIGGIFSNSLSLFSDAIHNLGDSAALFTAFLASKISHKKPDYSHTFGYKRVEIIAALFNATILVGISIFLFYGAYQRFMHPEPIKGLMMLIVACFGLLANVISVFILNKNKKHNLNVKAAYLHLIGDTMSSVAVILGGLLIWKWNIIWVDPLITTLVSIYIIYHTWNIIRQTVNILMQKAPADIDIDEIKQEIEKNPDIQDIHHLHIWNLNDNIVHLETHVNLAQNVDMKKMMEIKANIEDLLHNRFHISHTTLQMEYINNDKHKDLINKVKN